MDSYIKWPYPIANHYCRITWVYNKNVYQIPKSDDFGKHIRKGPPKKKLKYTNAMPQDFFTNLGTMP